MERVDTVVVGAGFGGLGAALALAARGRRVVVCEALNYAGGCASTHTRRGVTFESGATLLTGLSPGGALRRWIEAWELPVEVRLLDPAMTLRGPGLSLTVPTSRAAMVEALGGRPEVRAFFDLQAAVADPLWELLEEPSLLPPFGPAGALRHLGRLPRTLPVARWVGRPLSEVFDRVGVRADDPLRRWADALCQITVQVPAAQAEAPFALSALDFPFRGVGHARGGMGALAAATVQAIEARGGEVRLADRVREVVRDGTGWRVVARSGELWAPDVISGVPPGAFPIAPRPAVEGLQRDLRRSWGAAVWYLQVQAAGLPPEGAHLQLWDDPDAPPIDGNLVLCSVSEADEGRAPPGRRAVTVSTHLSLDGPPEALPDRVAAVQARMRSTIARWAPELRVLDGWTASPRTFERFTRRPGGRVGGVPRRVGLGQYVGLWPRPVAPGLWFVGDTVGLGQSVLATALTGARTAARVAGAA